MKLLIIFLFQLILCNFAYSIDKQFNNIAGVSVNKLFALNNHQLNNMRCDIKIGKDSGEYFFIFSEDFEDEISVKKIKKCKNKFIKMEFIEKNFNLKSINIVKTNDFHVLQIMFNDKFKAKQLIDIFFKDFENIYSYTFNGEKYFYIKNKTYDILVEDDSIRFTRFYILDEINSEIEFYFK